MKSPQTAEVIIGRGMKISPQSGAPSSDPGQPKRRQASLGLSSKPLGPARFGMPMEWVGGSSWRLPSGKALAEFALQAGFLAPLMLGSGIPGAQSSSSAVTSGGGIKRRKAADILLTVTGTTDSASDLKHELTTPRAIQ